MSEPISITSQDLSPADGRFDRFSLIGWWDQNRLRNARVLVIGAGALGNEIIKNLALLGVGRVVIVDKDLIENSNLSRSVLYRAADKGKPKSITAADAAKSIYPDMKVVAMHCDVIHDLGACVYEWADLVLGGLDNREARLSINRHCWRLGKPWIDGAIEVIQGVARVFVPDVKQENPCYECTMSHRDWQLLAHRRSCNLLTRKEMETGRVPTTPTIASIIAGVQVQEAVKLLHELPIMAGKGFVFAGDTADSYQVEYQRKPDCLSHDTLSQIEQLDGRSSEISLRALIDHSRRLLGEDAVIELGRDVAKSLYCPKCGKEEDVYRSLASLGVSDAACPHCGHDSRDIRTFTTLRGDEPFLNRKLDQIGMPLFDIVTARTKDRAIGIKIQGDAPDTLGELAFDELILD